MLGGWEFLDPASLGGSISTEIVILLKPEELAFVGLQCEFGMMLCQWVARAAQNKIPHLLVGLGVTLGGENDR